MPRAWTIVLLCFCLAGLALPARQAAASLKAQPPQRAAISLAGLFEPLPGTHSALLRRAWAGVLARTAGADGFCPAGEPACRRWQELKAGLAGMTDRRRVLAGVNAALNALPYRSDSDAWGRGDYWASPLEFLRRGGDCEDYAIAKYLMLRELGVPDADMRIVIVQDVVRRLPHALLVVSTGAGAVILDSLAGRLVPATAAAHYRPLYAVNQGSLWIYV